MKQINAIFKQLGFSLTEHEGKELVVASPIDGQRIASLKIHSKQQITRHIAESAKAFDVWRLIPAPKRGELVRIFGNVLREHKEPLSQLVTIECGKILTEGRGEVQEMIDICDFAVGLSRQLYGLTIQSERAEHVMQERWEPLGTVGVISAFNFPVAVWAWNAAIALVCGNSVVWKPSEKTPLTAIACQHLLEKAYTEFTKETGIKVPKGLSAVILGGREAGQQLVEDGRIRLVSATGSSAMGRIVGPLVANRFGKCLLELGGNNAIVVAPSADLPIALPGIVFGAVGTAGQRCTTTRRLFVHQSIYKDVVNTLKTAYRSIIKSNIGDPLQEGTLVGPLIDAQALDAMQNALKRAKNEGGTVHFGKPLKQQGAYSEPAIVEMKEQTNIVLTETFAPILYVMPYTDLDDAIGLINAAPQGLSAAIMTTDVREAERFRRDVECGIVNVNIGTSGAEIGGAFGGEKETGGGRESGSDAWKQYMRRVTSTTFFGRTPPALAQGVMFEV